MKNIFKMGILSTCIGLFFSCKEQVSPLSEDYYKKNGAIYFIPGGNGFERGSRKTEADINSFSVIKGVYARDKDKIYFMGCPQQFVDVKTFRLKGKIPVDQSHVFDFVGFPSATGACSKQQLTVITGADPETYTTLYDSVASLSKDKSHYFYKAQPLAVDYTSFKILNKNFVKDKNRLYVVTQKSINPLSYTTDKINVLNSEYLIIDGKTLLYYEPYQNIGVLETTLPSANKIKLLDKKSIIIDQFVIIQGKRFPFADVDAESFKILEGIGGNSFWSGDKNHIFYNEQPLAEADPKTFEVLKRAVAKDARHIFVGDKIFEGPDVKSFRVVDKSKTNHDFEDDLGHKYWYRPKEGGAELIPVEKK
ncbi:DKNYY domain-containing protein [Sphingobacterium athyrii]|nr:DKNYY domain-containing protein [Sphingobacterium athyrii]